jgi:hypothetical protein
MQPTEPPWDELSDGIGRWIGERIEAMTPAFASLLAAAGNAQAVVKLGLEPADEALLAAGKRVLCRHGDRSWWLRRVVRGDAVWLLSQEVTAFERANAAIFAAARVRALGEIAGVLVHDLGNHLSAGLGLAGLLREQVADADDRRILDQLQQVAQSGARMARVLADLLRRDPRHRGASRLEDVVEDVLTVVRPAAVPAAIAIEVAVHAAPDVRADRADATQALLLGILDLLRCQPRRLAIEVGVAERAPANGRGRASGVVLVRAHGVTELAAAALTQRTAGAVSELPDAAQQRGRAEDGIAVAALLQRWLGGDLAVRREGEQLVVDYAWPAARSPFD